MAKFKYFINDINTIIRGQQAALGLRMKPSFIIVGAQKAGTTAIFEILSNHTQIIPPNKIELKYFSNDLVYNKYKDNPRYYGSFFPLKRPHKITFEKTPIYLYDKNAPKRIFKHLPESKIIIILRDPSARAISAYNFYKSKFPQYLINNYGDDMTLMSIINNEIKKVKKNLPINNPIGIVDRGIYLPQIKRYMDCFSKKNILILDYYSFINNFNDEIKKIESFLEIKHEKLNNLHYNVSKSNRSFIEEKTILKEFYHPYNIELFDYLKRDFNW